MEGDYEIPPISLAYPVNKPTIYTVNDTVIPPKGHTFSRMQIKARWEDLRHASYLKAEYTWASGEIQVIYGWIDSVTLLSDSADAPMCQIDWHIDYWRTYKGVVDFGPGLVKRAPSSPFPQTPPMTVWSVSDNDVISFKNGDTAYAGQTVVLYWLIFTYVESQSSTASVKIYTAPLPGLSANCYIKISGGDPQKTIPLSSLFFGTWDEQLGLDPAKIKGAWISPISPSSYTGDGSIDKPFNLSGWRGVKRTGGESAIFVADLTSTVVNQEFFEMYYATAGGVSTDDTTRYVITGFDGESVGELPWGKSVTELTYRIAVSTNSAYMQIRTSRDGHVEGTCYTIPLPVVDTIENAMSTYNYSGQRAYDMEMRQIGVYSQIAGSSTNAIGGAIAGGTSGGGAAGAVAGAVVGLGTSLVGAGLNQYVFNPMIQGAKDTLVSKQSSGLLMSGAAVYDIIVYGRCPRLIKMTGDTESIQRRSEMLSRYGCTLDLVYDSCESLINAGGPLQIQDLTVGGKNVPVEAKVYIKSLFARGVNIVLK